VKLKRRRLPHLHVIGQPLFVTFRLHGSLPVHRPFAASNLTSGEAFLTMDRLLDQARSGPTFLRQPDIAQLVLASIEYGAELGHYQTHAFVVTPNHVHLLLTPQVSASKLLGSLKASTARRANPLLQRIGQLFWQDESYDHLVHSGDEFRRIPRYIENNPVTACLAATPEQYAWSSAGRPARPPQAEGLPPPSVTKRHFFSSAGQFSSTVMGMSRKRLLLSVAARLDPESIPELDIDLPGLGVMGSAERRAVVEEEPAV
jgi:REP-associated tyrosine transposase